LWRIERGKNTVSFNVCECVYERGSVCGRDGIKVKGFVVRCDVKTIKFFVEDRKMKKVLFGLMCMCVAFVMTSFAADVVVYENNYDSQTAGTGFGAWNWGDAGLTHTATYEDWGSIVVQHQGTFTNTTTAAVNVRFGSKWDIAMSGNTSANAADYTISFDLMSVMGAWDPMPLELWILTGGGNGLGYGIGGISVSQAAGWTHVEVNMADMTWTWWNGTAWDLTSASWAIELGGPGWPGRAVQPGESIDQMWLMDNLNVTMAIPEPASLVLLGLGSLTMLRKRK
jgi:hypothetical protein